MLSKGGIANAPSVKVRYSVTNDDAFSPVSYVVVDRAYHTIMCRALLDLRPSDCKESEPRLKVAQNSMTQKVAETASMQTNSYV